jgi:malonyl-CoA/methylmalonyl-CoA synthetase
MSSYKIPKDIKLVDALPRNAMGKVTKPALKELV